MRIVIDLTPNLVERLTEERKIRGLIDIEETTAAVLEQHFFDKDVASGKPFLLKSGHTYVVVYANETKSKEFDNKEEAERFLAHVLAEREPEKTE